jgi:3-deoxy-7-phosphoheptulonate synthase
MVPTAGAYPFNPHPIIIHPYNSFSVNVAIDAMHSASNPHAFMGVTEQGLAAIVKTRGNKDVHVVLRGGTKGPNFASEHVRKAAQTIEQKKAKVDGEKPFASIMIDCSRKFL